ncbi:MAG: hypothetical protein WC971_10050 [Coriobacteriia bacterium]
MTEKKSPVTTKPTDAAGASAGQAWADVLARMSDLAEAVARWAKAAANDPDNRQKLDQVRTGINDMAQKADAALGHVSSSDIGQHVKEGAEQAGQAIGGAAHRVAEVAAPHVRNAFAGLSDAFGKAAAKMEETKPETPEKE